MLSKLISNSVNSSKANVLRQNIDEVRCSLTSVTGIAPTQVFTLTLPHLDNLPYIEFVIDTVNRKFAMIHFGRKLVYPFSFQELISCELRLDNSVITENSTGATIVGGMLGGTTGAIIGQSFSKTESVVNELAISLRLNNFERPLFTINLLARPVKRNDPFFKKTLEFARLVEASLQHIIYTNQNMGK